MAASSSSSTPSSRSLDSSRFLRVIVPIQLYNATMVEYGQPLVPIDDQTFVITAPVHGGNTSLPDIRFSPLLDMVIVQPLRDGDVERSKTVQRWDIVSISHTSGNLSQIANDVFIVEQAGDHVVFADDNGKRFIMEYPPRGYLLESAKASMRKPMFGLGGKNAILLKTFTTKLPPAVTLSYNLPSALRAEVVHSLYAKQRLTLYKPKHPSHSQVPSYTVMVQTTYRVTNFSKTDFLDIDDLTILDQTVSESDLPNRRDETMEVDRSASSSPRLMYKQQRSVYPESALPSPSSSVVVVDEQPSPPPSDIDFDMQKTVSPTFVNFSGTVDRPLSLRIEAQQTVHLSHTRSNEIMGIVVFQLPTGQRDRVYATPTLLLRSSELAPLVKTNGHAIIRIEPSLSSSLGPLPPPLRVESPQWWDRAADWPSPPWTKLDLGVTTTQSIYIQYSASETSSGHTTTTYTVTNMFSDSTLLAISCPKRSTITVDSPKLRLLEQRGEMGSPQSTVDPAIAYGFSDSTRYFLCGAVIDAQIKIKVVGTS